MARRCHGPPLEEGHEFLEVVVHFRRISAARFLLPVEFWPCMAQRSVGLPYCARLFHHSDHTSVVCPQASRRSIWLDVWTLRSVYRRVRHDAPYGSVESVARTILARGGHQGYYRGGIPTHRYPAGPHRTAGAGAAKQQAVDTSECRAAEGSPRRPGTGTRTPHQRSELPRKRRPAGFDSRRDLCPKFEGRDRVLE